jgi:hypothetical protein
MSLNRFLWDFLKLRSRTKTLALFFQCFKLRKSVLSDFSQTMPSTP